MFPSTNPLPIDRADMARRGWNECDFIFISGDAYVDHPSFGAALLSRFLESKSYKVGIIAQPENNPEAVSVLGRPRYAFLVSSGNMDSMVNHYTANKKPRSSDAFSPGGKAGKRPDRALTAYCNLIRQAFPKAPIVIGGIEASLRRLSHYDYWSETLKKSILLDAKADILVYGMGERALEEIARRLAEGQSLKQMRDIRGTVWRCAKEAEIPSDCLRIPSHEEQKANKDVFGQAFLLQYRNADPLNGRPLAEASSAGFAVQNSPALPLSTEELDALYELPYTRSWHPRYTEGVPALSEVKFSLTSSRGCFGACSFCALSFHQGRHIQARSKASLLREAAILCQMPDFKGIIHDVGGPTANFRANPCKKMGQTGACMDRRCLFPKPCPQLKAEHREYMDILKALTALPGVKKVFIRSGIRFDYLLLDKQSGFLEALCKNHVSGQLKTAPEHVSPQVLAAMGKPAIEVHETFRRAFEAESDRLGLKQYIIPYYISAHPGSGLRQALELAEHLRDAGFVPDHAQDFYPTPGTLSSCMYYTGKNPETAEPLYIPSGAHERSMQRALLQYTKPENRALVIEALETLGRQDLIGTGSRCLVRPYPSGREAKSRLK